MIKVIWSSNGELDDLLQMPADQKRLELTNWYDKEMVDQLADDELDKIIGDNADIFYNEAMEDFEYNIVPMISNQFLGGFVLDENFNVVDPGVLLSDARETCEIYEDDNGDLYWKDEGRKAIPLLGFDEDQDKFIDQLDQLDILSTMHNLYPDQDDEDIEIYDIADLIPFDWTLLENVLNHAVNNLDVVEELTEAKAKNPNKLADELKEIKDLSEEYGREYFTQMPFTSYDNDPISIEVQYPEFFRVVKSFFKEMGILEGDDLNNPDVLDMSWDTDISQHDWDVIMRACDKLVQGKGVQFEKEYKTGYNSVLDDDEILANREQDESLNEDVDIDLSKVNSSDMEKAKAEVLKNQQLQKFKNDDSLDQALRLYAILNGDSTGEDLRTDWAKRNDFLYFYRDFLDAQKTKDIKVYDYDDERRDKMWAKMTVSQDSLNKLKNDLTNESLNEDNINPELYKPFGHDSYDSGYIHEPELPYWWDPEEDEARILPPDADDEDWEDDLDEDNADSLKEDTVTWPWGDPNEELPQKKLPDKTSSDSLVNKLI